jgi:hypothetical protein
MDNDVKFALLEQFNALDGKLFALQRALRVMIKRDVDVAGARRAIEVDLDSFIAGAASHGISAERRASVREVQERLIDPVDRA